MRRSAGGGPVKYRQLLGRVSISLAETRRGTSVDSEVLNTCDEIEHDGVLHRHAQKFRIPFADV